jgi:uncharacterized protein
MNTWYIVIGICQKQRSAMPRPCKMRRVDCDPLAFNFKPCGIPRRDLETVCLTLDELEALRLADLEELYQENAARKMNVSRQTFGNIIASAHKKVADFLINSKHLSIEGGSIMMNERSFTCSQCNHVWPVPCGTCRPNQCPQCKSEDIHRAEGQRGCGRRGGWGRGNRRGTR